MENRLLMLRTPAERETREPVLRGWLSLNQATEGAGLPATLQSRVRASPWRPVVVGGRETLGGAVHVEKVGGREEEGGKREMNRVQTKQPVLEAWLLDMCSHGNLPRTFRYTFVELLPTTLAAVQVNCCVSAVMMSLIVRVPPDI